MIGAAPPDGPQPSTAGDGAAVDAETRLATLNWALTAYARSTSALLHADSLGSVAKSVCEAIVADDTYVLAAVALAEPLPGKALRIVAGAGRATGYLDGLNLSWADDVVEGSGPTGRAIRNARPEIMRDSLLDPVYAPWREKGLGFGIRSSVTVPFFRDGVILGVLLVYAPRPDAFGVQEVTLFQHLADELAFAIALERDRERLAAAQEAEAGAIRRLKKSEGQLRAIAGQVLDVIIQYDPQGAIEYASPSSRQIGYGPDELIGRNIRDFFVAGEGEAPGRGPGGPLPIGLSERQITRRDGSRMWVQGNTAAIRDDAGKVVGVVTVLRDMSERRAMEDELRRKRAEAEVAVAAKAQFLANMSHEIRTPLTSVIGFAGLMERMEGLPDKARTYVQRILRGGEALQALVDDILDFSRIEAGGVQLEPEPVELAPFLQNIVELVGPAARAKGLEVRIEQTGALPASVSVDAKRLQQVLLNLIGNAIKFTDQGGVTVRAGHSAAGDGVLRVEVQDTGVGISPDHLGRLFQRFSQVDESDTRFHGGAGLGLAISKGLIEALGGEIGGEIGVESEKGRGSTFWFTAPAPPAAAPQIDPQAAVETEVSGPDPVRILVVDDLAVNRELVRAILSPFGVELAEAGDGQAAVEAATAAVYDLILMDLQMPGVDGHAAARLIRASCALNASTPILALSASVLPEQLDACREAGMDDHVAKPINPTELLTKVSAWTKVAATELTA